jgi:hypothetical protein
VLVVELQTIKKKGKIVPVNAYCRSTIIDWYRYQYRYLLVVGGGGYYGTSSVHVRGACHGKWDFDFYLLPLYKKNTKITYKLYIRLL